jgi:hypothetical protein
MKLPRPYGHAPFKKNEGLSRRLPGLGLLSCLLGLGLLLGLGRHGYGLGRDILFSHSFSVSFF